jgi:formylglycine-generating enzyme required for sulfatase activity
VPIPRPGAPTPAQPGKVANVPSGPSGPDPCAKAGMAGTGTFCRDSFGTSYGPFMVVVPGAGGGRPYAMSRAEVSINEFNAFCRASGKCAAKSVSDPDLGNAPITNIPLSQAQAYARWLSDVSGFSYRLPTDAEWLNAASAGGRFKQAEDSNCVPPSAGGGDGSGALVSARGRSRNPWGLVNMTGNAWEWVVSGGSVAVRGGSYTSYWSDCSVGTQRSDGGSPQRDVGFRILREVK